MSWPRTLLIGLDRDDDRARRIPMLMAERTQWMPAMVCETSAADRQPYRMCRTVVLAGGRGICACGLRAKRSRVCCLLAKRANPPLSTRASRLACLLGFAILGALFAGPALGQLNSPDCPALAPQQVGPWDYRTDSKNPRVTLMERLHFSPKTEAALQGTSTTEVAPDLEFVLRHVPNHYRALASSVRLAARQKTDRPRGAQFGVRCHFERAIAFRPDDAGVRVMYGDYLLASGSEAVGLGHLDVAKQTHAHDPYTQYIVGMVYAERGYYEQALAQAHKALTMGFGRTELKTKLQSAGRWREPPPTGPVEPE